MVADDRPERDDEVVGDGTPVRVGVIGAGYGARVVAPAFAGTDGCTVVDVVSARDDAAVSELCARRDVDLVTVHSPPFLHLEHVRRAVDAGHAVLCDKPFGVNALEAEQMATFAREAGGVGIVNYEYRYHPLWSRLQALVRERIAGAVELVVWTALSGSWPAERPFGWLFDASRGGGWVRAYGSHAIDFVRATFGEIVDASAGLRTTIPRRAGADGHPRRCTAEDGFTARLRTDTGAWLSMESTATAPVGRSMHVTVVGSDGVLELAGDDQHAGSGRIVLHTEAGSSELFQGGEPDGQPPGWLLAWTAAIRDAVRTGAVPPGLPSFADGLSAARVMDQLTGRRGALRAR